MSYGANTWTSTAAVLLLGAGGCGDALELPGADASGEDAVRAGARCQVLPDPVPAESAYTVTGDGFSRLKAVRVRIQDAAGDSESVITADGGGSFVLPAAATIAGPGEVTVFTDGRSREALLTRCVFAVVAATRCGDEVCAADEDCTSCALDCTCPDQEPGAFTLGAASYTVGESDGTVAIAIDRLGGSAGAVTVEWRTLSSTATFDVDYQSFTWTLLTFADGEARKVEAITILPDGLDEADETFSVLLRNPTGGATLGMVTAATVTIVDDDTVSLDPCAGVSCSGHGLCVVTTGAPACDCATGFHAAGLSCVADAVLPPPSGSLPVFPGAAGLGTSTPAGRGGAILRVTNLLDAGAGSLRAALSATGPRIVVFEVSGYIDLASDLRVTAPFVTIAGQTAPAPGICLRGNGLIIKTHDVLVQHLAIRPGLGSTADAIALHGVDGAAAAQTYNVVIDHCSFTWAIDENGSTWADQVRDVTWSNNIFAEGLRPHSMGMLIGDGASRISVIKNLFAHNYDRSPRIQGGKSERAFTQLVNNLIFDAYSISTINSVYGTFPQSVDAVGNVAVDTATTSGGAMYKLGGTVPGAELYRLDNVHYTAAGAPTGAVASGLGGNAIEVYAPATNLDGITVLPSSQVEAYVKGHVGARPAERNTVDARIVGSVTSRSGGFISNPDEVGGYPTLAANRWVFAEGANPSGDDDGDGYTNVEELLHELAATVEGR